MPGPQAMDFLNTHDPLERGLYAGAVGLLNKSHMEICVSIRSLLCDEKQNKVILFGGAGIVEGSTARNEWEETGHKMASFSPFNVNNK